jgi:hypothetical protein
MKGQNGVQFQAHPVFIEFKKKVKNERIKIGKEGSGDLSDKRLSKTFVKLLSLPQNYELLINAEINLKED